MLAARPLHNTAPNTLRKENRVSRPVPEQATGSKAGERLKWIGTIVFCTAVLCGIIGQFSEIARANLEVERLKAQVQEQQEQNAKLNDRVNELSSPSRIIEKARQMGMVSANQGALAKAGKE